MTATTSSHRSADLSDLLARVERIAPEVEASARRHDADASIAQESIQLAREAGLLAMAVPTELGGLGATIRQVSMVQRALARHCGSTALATAMHQHSVCFNAWQYRHGARSAESILERVLNGELIVTTGGADFTRPSGSARRVAGGYVVSGRKRFCSLSSAASILSTMFPIDENGDRRVINVAIPLPSEGVTIVENWDTLGMRATASNDIVIDEVFVPDEAAGTPRPYGQIDPPLQVVICIALPIIAAVYLGIAEAAFAAATRALARRAQDPIVQRHVGAMEHRLQVATWALDGALAVTGDDPVTDPDRVAAVSIAKDEIAQAAVDVCDSAMEVAGGEAFFKGSVIERCYRDARAAKFHPFTPDATLTYAGRRALGLEVEEY